MLDRFDAPTDRLRRTWVRWCELELDLARSAYDPTHYPPKRLPKSGRAKERYEDAVERVYHARDEPEDRRRWSALLDEDLAADLALRAVVDQPAGPHGRGPRPAG